MARRGRGSCAGGRAITPQRGKFRDDPVRVGVPLNRWITQESNVEGERVEALSEVLGLLHGVYPEEMTHVARGLVRLEGEKLAHVPTRHKLRNESEALDEWDRFEDILHAILGHRHERQARMDENLAEIESW